mmetsp:Transcript_39733/g.124085  ORF Transcript_39733/g.124085 Transcript_39733/m.124085 type:complete len:223 (+) Transcript_39733:115-783(+)
MGAGRRGGGGGGSVVRAPHALPVHQGGGELQRAGGARRHDLWRRAPCRVGPPAISRRRAPVLRWQPNARWPPRAAGGAAALLRLRPHRFAAALSWCTCQSWCPRFLARCGSGGAAHGAGHGRALPAAHGVPVSPALLPFATPAQYLRVRTGLARFRLLARRPPGRRHRLDLRGARGVPLRRGGARSTARRGVALAGGTEPLAWGRRWPREHGGSAAAYGTYR